MQKDDDDDDDDDNNNNNKTIKIYKSSPNFYHPHATLHLLLMSSMKGLHF